MQKAEAIANDFLDIARADGKTLSPMKIQKLVYFADGWCLAIKDEQLFKEEIQAWKFGPVILSLYHNFKDCGDDPIDHYAHTWEFVNGRFTKIEPKVAGDDTPFVKQLLAKIWEIYGKWSAVQLSNMTHASGTPWHQISSQFPNGLPRRITIPRDTIRDYFRGQAATT